jgi:large subunit ribosomal protein L7/L12
MLDRMAERVELELNALDALKREQKIKDMVRVDDTDKILEVVRDMGLRMIRADDEEAVKKAADALGLIGPCYGPPPGDRWSPTWKGYRVYLTKYPSDRKISIIKEIRTLTGIGLREAKNASEMLPYEITKTESEDKAATWARRLREAGGSVEIQEYDV